MDLQVGRIYPVKWAREGLLWRSFLVSGASRKYEYVGPLKKFVHTHVGTYIYICYVYIYKCKKEKQININANIKINININIYIDSHTHTHTHTLLPKPWTPDLNKWILCWGQHCMIMSETWFKSPPVLDNVGTGLFRMYIIAAWYRTTRCCCLHLLGLIVGSFIRVHAYSGRRAMGSFMRSL